jgi:hypothetical protein
MKRLLPLALLAFLLLPSGAGADGCPPEQCGVRALSVPGAPTVVLQLPGGLAGYDVATGRKRFSAQEGVVSADGRTLVVARYPNGRTLLERFDVGTGRLVVRRRFPTQIFLSGVSADGRRVALHEATSYRGTTRLVTLDLATGRTKEATLTGRFVPEAISNDGQRLFVIQYVGRAYHVRLYDVGRRALSGDLRPVNENEPMRGTPVYAVGSPDGRWLLTLYAESLRKGFVHALDLEHGKAYCIDLPDAVVVNQYGLALAPDGRTLVAVNLAAGTLAQIDLGTAEVGRPVHFGRGAAPNYTNVAFSPRGDLVYFAGLRGVRAYDVRTRRVRGPYRVGPVGGIAFTGDGRRLIVLRPSGKNAFWLDAATGARL